MIDAARTAVWRSLTKPLPALYQRLASARLPCLAVEPGGTQVKRRHGFLIAVVLGAAAVAGTSAMLQTVSLGADASSATEEEIAKADMRLDRQEARIQRASKRRPPKLPAVPTAGSGAGAPAAGSAAPAGAADASREAEEVLDRRRVR
ncbi:MAG TPA: hypothetical protein VG126_12745, partial [Thermoleophilaceae bacterium]|nr:hypothetical protein [Thermoleophilaceae bacterium]